MIISAKYNLVVLHTPKTGGTSLSRALVPVVAAVGDGHYVGPRRKTWRHGGGDVTLGIWPGRGPVPEGHPGTAIRCLNGITQDPPVVDHVEKHATFDDLAGFLREDFLRSAKIIVTVRDPVARALSAYRFMTRHTMAQHRRGPLASRIAYMLDGEKPISFDSFIMDDRTMELVAAKPQSLWADCAQGDVRLVRTEALAQDASDALIWAGVGPDAAAAVYEQLSRERANTTSDGSRPEPISEAARQRIHELYKDDFDLLREAFPALAH